MHPAQLAAVMAATGIKDHLGGGGGGAVPFNPRSVVPPPLPRTVKPPPLPPMYGPSPPPFMGPLAKESPWITFGLGVGGGLQTGVYGWNAIKNLHKMKKWMKNKEPKE
tara:strand:+ start:122 stop:445 length:324 start_codon:yes stop_codon:yes gene_type:complete